jgi:ribosome-binding protein aMBF1 (putative translation factor)
MRRAGLREIARFEIDPYGAFLHWPGRDVHIGWPQLEQAADPHAHLRARQRDELFNRQYGRAIRAFREERGLTQREVAGLDPRTVRRIEQGVTRATSSALRKLAAAHGLAPNEYLAQVAERLTG